MNEIVLKSLGKRKVRKILNQWVKDQINIALELDNNRIQFDYVIWFDEYDESLANSGIEPIEYDEAFKFIGNKI